MTQATRTTCDARGARPGRTRQGLTARTSSVALALGLLWAVQPAPVRAQAFQATPTFTVGGGNSVEGTGTTDVYLSSNETVIDWTLNEAGPNTTFDFLPAGTVAAFHNDPNASLSGFTVLNRINSNFGAPTVQFNGAVQSDLYGSPAGNVWFYAPGGIIVGSTATFNVGSLVLTTNDIDVTGGLFGSNGEIRFRGAAGSTSAIQILNGAQINTTIGNSYVAIVAPRIEQGGTINADGSTALVAAEQADLIFNAGLFDVDVLVGSTDANGIVHTGSTGGPASLSAGDIQRVTMVAVAKNTAMTMLLSGNIGYVPAASAAQDGSAVQLSAGYSTVGDTIGAQAGGAPVGITIGNTTFTSKLGTPYGDASVASGTIDISPTGLGTTEFKGDLYLRSDTAINLTANAGETVLFDGSSVLAAQQDGLGGTISLLAQGVPASGQPVGKITAVQTLDLEAQGTYPFTQNPPGNGRSATGGAITVTADGGTISGTDLFGNSNATGEDGLINGGLAQGGSLSLIAQGGGTLSFASTSLRAYANGGGSAGGTGVGGDGKGGDVAINDMGGTLDLGSVSADVTGSGGGNAATGGTGFGGRVAITIGSVPQTWSDLSVYADSSGGLGSSQSGGLGGNATGDLNAIQIAITGPGALDITNYLALSAAAYVAPNTAVTGTGTGGGITVSASNNGALGVGGIFQANASADINIDTSFDSTLPSPNMQGGTVSVVASGGGQMALHDVRLKSDAQGVPVDVLTGNAIGGSVTLGAESGGAIVQSAISGTPLLTLEAVGVVNNGLASSNGTGGTVLLYAQDGSITSPGTVTLDAGARVGFNNYSGASTGGDARGGTATVEIRSGTNGTGALSFGTLNILADGQDDTYQTASQGYPDVDGNGGQGIGGMATLHQSAGTLSVGSITVSALGSGAGSLSNVNGPTGYVAGNGTGGSSAFLIDGGTATTTTLSITANGVGGTAHNDAFSGEGAASGGAGFGGSAKLDLSGGSLIVNGSTPVSITATGTGGLGMSSLDTAAGNGGAAFGGGAQFSEAGLGTSVTVPGITLQAIATGGDGGTMNLVASGNGGNASAGTDVFKIADGGFAFGDVQLLANGIGGTGVTGGDVFGGSAAFSLIDVALNSGTVPSGFARTIANLTLNANALGGVGSVTSGTGTSGQTAMTVQAGAPAGALTLGGTLAVTALGDISTTTPGFALTMSGQPFTVTGDATISSTSPVSFQTDIGAPFHVGGNLLVTTAGSVTGTGPILVDGNSQINAVGIDLERLSSGGATDLLAGAGLVRVGIDLESTGLVTAIGGSIDLTSLGSLEFTPLSSPGGNIVIDLAGNGQFDGVVQSSAGLSVTTGGTATFNAAVSGSTISLDIGSNLHLLDTLDATGSIDVTTRGTGTAQFDAAVGAPSATFNIAGNVAFASTLNTSGALGVTGGGSATFTGAVSGGDLTFGIGADAVFQSTLATTGALTVTTGGNGSFQQATVGGDAMLSIGNAGTFGGPLQVAGALNLSTIGAATFVGPVSAATASFDFGTDALFQNSLATTGDVNLKTGASATFNGAVSGHTLTFDVGTVAHFLDVLTASGDIFFTSGGDATFDGAVSADPAYFTIGGNAYFGSTLTTNNALGVTAGTAVFASTVTASDFTVVLQGDVQFDQALNITTSFTLQTTGSATFATALSVGSITVTTGTDASFVNGLAATGAVTVDAGRDALFAASVSGGSVTVSAGRDARFDAAVAGGSALTVTAGGLATFSGAADGQSIIITSNDIDIGPAGQLGTLAGTSQLTLQPGTGVASVFIGGTGQSSGYSLSQSEFSRLHANLGIQVVPLASATNGAMTIGDLSVSALSGGNLGPNGQLTLGSQAALSVLGRIDFAGAGTNNTLLLSGSTIVVHRDTASISLQDASGGLQGNLVLTADSVDVAGEQALADLSGLSSLSQISTRLGLADGAPNDLGALSADHIQINAISHIYIQNSGASTGIADRRGFTANNFDIFTSVSPLAIAVNGRIADPQGTFLTGYDAADQVRVNGVVITAARPNLMIASTINGCIIGVTCGLVAPGGSLPPHDTISNLVDNGSPAPDSFQMAPIELGGTTVLDSSPLVDEPVTSVGNDDLWQSGCDPAGTQACE